MPMPQYTKKRLICVRVPAAYKSPASHTHIKPPLPRFLPLIKLQPVLLPDRAQLQLWMHYRQRHKETPPLEPVRLPRALGQRGPQRPWGVRKHCMPSARPSTRPQNHHQGHIKGWLAANASDTLPSSRWTRLSLFKLHHRAWMSKI